MLEGGPSPAELEFLIAQVIVEAHRHRRQDIASQLGRIELRTMRNGGAWGPCEEFKTERLESYTELTLGLARLLDKPKTAAKQLPATIYSPIAAQRMEDYRQKQNLTQTDFAGKVGRAERTLRNFRMTGSISRRLLTEIAQAMDTTLEALVKE